MGGFGVSPRRVVVHDIVGAELSYRAVVGSVIRIDKQQLYLFLGIYFRTQIRVLVQEVATGRRQQNR